VGQGKIGRRGLAPPEAAEEEAVEEEEEEEEEERRGASPPALFASLSTFDSLPPTSTSAALRNSLSRLSSTLLAMKLPTL